MIINEDLTIGNFEFHLNGCGMSVGDNLEIYDPTSEVTGSPTPSVNVTNGLGCRQQVPVARPTYLV